MSYDGQSRCEPHGVTRCVACTMLERKKAKLEVAPPEITGAPPVDIEQMDGPALRAEKAAYDKAIFATEPPFDQSQEQETDWSRPKPGPTPSDMTKDAFDALPTDDSHASKVMRAAARFSSTSRDWAQNLARTEKIKANLLKAEAELSEAKAEMDKAQDELKTLVTGEQS